MTKTRPILFNGEMVRAILDGRKTQTRRVVKPQPRFIAHTHPSVAPYWRWEPCKNFSGTFTLRFAREFSTYGAPGDRLWVRETWMPETEQGIPTGGIIWRASDNKPMPDGDGPLRWKPSIHMPKSASRITLEVTGMQVERVQDISEEDAYAEGIDLAPTIPHPLVWFRDLWDSINVKRGFGWDANPWVWVVAFRSVDAVPR